ncbi:hypothetical protein [Peribacillus muralis]|uniref:hypothetical protein n=1 Tax=Peribacillus muralis TaxID=264697 RepID=UPI003CFD4BA6
MIELKNFQNEPYLVINHITIERDKINLIDNPNEITFEVISNEVISKIKRMPLNKIHLEHESDNLITIQFSYPWEISGVRQSLYLFKEPEETYFRLLIDFSWELEKWKNIFSTEELVVEVQKETKKYDISSNHDMEGCEFTLICNLIQNNNIEDYLHIATRIMRSAVNQLMIENKKGSLTSVFEFPEHVRVPCEQYLIYFSEFLKNIGIVANTEITHQASQILFTVIPESKEIALGKIREALEIYLQLPSKVNTLGYINVPSDPKIQQLIANTQHLNSQLMLSNATIQMQASTIERQQTIIDQQQRMLDATILQTSLVAMSTSGKEDEKEELFGGTVALTKLEGKGFEVNIANIYRWIKNQFQKD